MKRILILLSCAATLTGATMAMAAGHRARLQLGSTSLGRIVENGQGFTIYMFTRDHRNRDSCVKVAGCTSVWPPVTTSGKPVAGPGVKRSLIGTIALAHGRRQVTYAGRPLYTYGGDGGPGSTSYNGFPEFGGTWWALGSTGRAVK